MLSTHVDGVVAVLDIKLSANLSASTIERVVSRRRALIAQMASNMADELGREAGAHDDRRREGFLCMLEQHDAEWYNDDENLKNALAQLVSDHQWFKEIVKRPAGIKGRADLSHQRVGSRRLNALLRSDLLDGVAELE